MGFGAPKSVPNVRPTFSTNLKSFWPIFLLSFLAETLKSRFWKWPLSWGLCQFCYKAPGEVCPRYVKLLEGIFGNNCATRAAIYRSLWALRARNRKKVSERVFWGVCRKKRKVPEKTRKILKVPKKFQKQVILDFFGYFPGLSAEDPFWDFFAISGPEGQRLL